MKTTLRSPEDFNQGTRYGVQLTLEFLGAIEDLLDILDNLENYPVRCYEKVDFISEVLINRTYTSENTPFKTWAQFRSVMELAEKILPYLPD